MVRILDLATVFNVLVEHSVLVADAVANNRKFEIGTAIQKARCEAAEASVAKPGVVFAFGKFFQPDSVLVSCLSGGLIKIKVLDCVARERPIRNSRDR